MAIAVISDVDSGVVSCSLAFRGSNRRSSHDLGPIMDGTIEESGDHGDATGLVPSQSTSAELKTCASSTDLGSR